MAQIVVEDAAVLEKVAPDDGNESGGDNDRQEEREPEEIEQPRRHGAVERKRQQQPDADIAGDGHQREAKGVPEDLLGARVGKEAGEIVEPNPVRAELRVVIRKAQDHRDQHRREHEDEIKRHRRKDEKISGARFAGAEVGASGGDIGHGPHSEPGRATLRAPQPSSLGRTAEL